MIRAFIYPVILLMAFGMMGIESEAEALETDAAEKVMRVQRVLAETERPRFQLQNNPVRAPRCPKFNVDREPLMESMATRSDGGEWVHECWYGVRT